MASTTKRLPCMDHSGLCIWSLNEREVEKCLYIPVLPRTSGEISGVSRILQRGVLDDMHTKILATTPTFADHAHHFHPLLGVHY